VSCRLTASTRLVALLGDPVRHSLSPVFQNAAFRSAGVDAVYLALRCDAEGFPALLRGVAAAGGAGNVTLPHKELAAGLVEVPTPAVLRTGACNTFWAADGRLCGDNTDVEGVARAIEELLGRAPAGARVLLLGAGGAARATLCALLDAGADRVLLANRSAERAARLRDRFSMGPGGDRPTRIDVADSARRLDGQRFDLVINATSMGLGPEDPFPLDPEFDVRFDAALDLVYSARGTPWVRSLAEGGVRAADGLTMLLYQGAAAFERWWGRPAPLDAMREALALRASDASGRAG
jgi:shikimate dehydrogenase